MHGCSQKSFAPLRVRAHAGDTCVSHLCVCTACSARGSRCAALCAHGQAGCVCVCVHAWAGSLCTHTCVPVATRPPWPPPGCSPGFGRAPLGHTSSPTRAGLRGKALTQQLVSILLHLQRRPRNENPMGTLVGVNKYAIKIRKSKLWTGLFSCPLISFITEILLLNNISVNNLSSVFCSARVNNSTPGGGFPPSLAAGPAALSMQKAALGVPSSAFPVQLA